MKRYYSIFDIEADDLLEGITKIHCLVFRDYDFNNDSLISSGELTLPIDIVNYFMDRSEDYYLVAHNGERYDIPAVEKVFDVKLTYSLIDTLGLSWYLEPYRKVHGLESYGEKFGVPKPKIEDWKNLKIEEYLHRCSEDVKINTLLFQSQLSYLKELYDNDLFSIFRICGYLTYKLNCLREQEEEGILLDKRLCGETKMTLENDIMEKTLALSEIMPMNEKKKVKTKPKKPYKKDGTLSVIGEGWFNLLEEQGLPETTEETSVSKFEEPNPNSSLQIKKWLYSLGWEPITFETSKSTGKEVEKVNLPDGKGICPSVKELYEIEPGLENLEGLGVLSHRLGIINSFLKTVDKHGRVKATAHGFTNTLRLQHSSPIVNLPKVNKPYGKEIRGCLLSPKGHKMMGSDISGLESATGDHYIYYFDPEYVKKKRQPGYDSHLDMGIVAGLITPDESNFYKWYKNKQ